MIMRKGRLYVIDTATGAATFLGDTGKFFASIAFAPDGTLYMSSADPSATEGLQPDFYCQRSIRRTPHS